MPPSGTPWQACGRVTDLLNGSMIGTRPWLLSSRTCLYRRRPSLACAKREAATVEQRKEWTSNDEMASCKSFTALTSSKYLRLLKRHRGVTLDMHSGTITRDPIIQAGHHMALLRPGFYPKLSQKIKRFHGHLVFESHYAFTTAACLTVLKQLGYIRSI